MNPFPRIFCIILTMTLGLACSKKESLKPLPVPVEKPLDTIRVENIQRPQRQIVLSNGMVLPESDGSMEVDLVAYFNEDYRKSLNVRYWVWDGIEFDKYNRLKPGSEKQIQNVTAILKQFPQVKVRLASYASAPGPISETTKKQLLELYHSLLKAGVNAHQLAEPVLSSEELPIDSSEGILLGVLPPDKDLK